MPTVQRARSVLAVQNLARATRYFIDVLGFTEDDITSPGWSFLSLDSFHVMLGECPDEISAEAAGNHAWFIHLIVDDVDRYHAELRARGAELLNAPTDRAYGLREFIVRTPDGHRLMIAQTIRNAG
jgi:catechol 2,3-dioxygenase-like lactoylglutathione lyase family enzyme